MPTFWALVIMLTFGLVGPLYGPLACHRTKFIFLSNLSLGFSRCLYVFVCEPLSRIVGN